MTKFASYPDEKQTYAVATRYSSALENCQNCRFANCNKKVIKGVGGKNHQMKKLIAVWLPFFICIAGCVVFAQTNAPSQSKQSPAAPTTSTDNNEKNVQAYIELLRTNIRQQKAEIMGSVMQLDVDEAAKFWPIYNQYDVELTKLNKLRIANIQEYAQNYDQMTDAKADELIQKALDYRKQRSELLAKYYGLVKTSLGSIQAARFVQIEDQLLMLIDLQITSSLPIIGQGS